LANAQAIRIVLAEIADKLVFALKDKKELAAAIAQLHALNSKSRQGRRSGGKPPSAPEASVTV
jgi:hypothetical protein